MREESGMLDVALADENLSASHPTLVCLSMAGGVVDVFDLATGAFVKRFELALDVPDLNVFLQPRLKASRPDPRRR